MHASPSTFSAVTHTVPPFRPFETFKEDYLLKYLSLSPSPGYRPSTRDLQSSPSCAFASSWFQVMPILLMSARRSSGVPLSLPLVLFPWGLQDNACLVVLATGFLNVCPVHLHFLLPISRSAGICYVLSHGLILLILSGQCTLRILRRQLLMKVCTFATVAFVILHVSAP